MFEQDVASKAVPVGNETKNGVPTEHWEFKGRFPFPQTNDWWFTPNGKGFNASAVAGAMLPPLTSHWLTSLFFVLSHADPLAIDLVPAIPMLCAIDRLQAAWSRPTPTPQSSSRAP